MTELATTELRLKSSKSPLILDQSRTTVHTKKSSAVRLFPLQKRAQKRGFKDYRRFRSLVKFVAVNNSHTFKRQCRHNFKCWNVFVIATEKKVFMQREGCFYGGP